MSLQINSVRDPDTTTYTLSGTPAEVREAVLDLKTKYHPIAYRTRVVERVDVDGEAIVRVVRYNNAD